MALLDQIMSFPTIQNVFACIIVVCSLLMTFISLAHPHQSWPLSFDLCCHPHLEACHLLTSLKHVSGISFNPRGGRLSSGKY
ncbi:hypothetical protein EDB85DRAFT_2004939 [Lactarius pseudohatsudake]|nr:hypothetical protein EDB85DRAFT_2004939 [Lactarius pseudohatsudake]